MASSPDKMPHAVVVPGRGQGHIKPCVLFARALAALGFDVSFVYFSSEYAKLTCKQRLPDQLGLDPHTVGGKGDGTSCSGGEEGGRSGLPSTANKQKGVMGIHVVEDGLTARDSDNAPAAVQENLLNFIFELQEQGRAPTCLVADPFRPWTQNVAERASIPFIALWPGTARAYVNLHLVPQLFSEGIFPEKETRTQCQRQTPLMLDLIPGVPPFSSELYPPEVRSADASNPMIRLICDTASRLKLAERVLLYALSELEPDAFRALRVLGFSGYAIGPLLYHDVKEHAVQPTSGGMDCMAWLNTQVECSVIYISFGSKAINISAEDIQELALGLEACGNAFLWVIRDDTPGGGGSSHMLPDGFLERTSEKGMIIQWAPQPEVLAHKAVGCFLTHCGWNSALESLWEGVPLLCCPIRSDQFVNSQLMCDGWGVGLQLRRTETGGIERRNVEVGVKSLMQGEEGLKARAKAREVKELARTTCQQGGQSCSNLLKFYKDMKELCCKQ